MAMQDIKVPQMGEGLTEVRLLQFLKTPGQVVARDEVIYTMETDKATLEVESPEAGTLVEWLAKEGDVLPIGAAVATIDVSADHAPAANAGNPTMAQAPAASPQPTSERTERVVPPRTRAYARELGMSEELLHTVPSVTAKLMPSDLDAYLAAGRQTEPDAVPSDVRSAFEDRPLPDSQRKLNFHLKRSAQTVIPGTISRPIEWSNIRDLVAKWRQRGANNRPTEFQTFAFCAAQATRSCPKFRCTLIREDTLRQYERLNLGVAVALAGGELTTAVVPDADNLPFPEFVGSLQERIQSARAGGDQADETVQLLLTYLGNHGVRDAVPVLVAPAAGVIFVGEAYSADGTLLANVSLTIDHRIMNGVEAAELLSAILVEVQRLAAIEPLTPL